MLSIHLMGGLGNELFMIFAAMAYAIQNNVKIVLPWRCNMEGHRHTYWDTFFSDLVIFTTANPSNGVSDDDIYSMELYHERNFTYDAFPHFGNKSICLYGYFQSYKYFEPMQSIIYQMIKLEEKKQLVRTMHADYFVGETVSMHFRMGDYKAKRYYHPIMNYEYFEESLKTIVSQRPGVSRVLYLCEAEDNEFVRGYISRFQNIFPNLTFVKVADDIVDYNQLLVMACCHHNIMANSTFSWWGAYMNENPEKIVCYPSKWFGQYYEHTHDHRDMMPEHWTKIHSEPIPWTLPLV
jgi:hypothetical protein